MTGPTMDDLIRQARAQAAAQRDIWSTPEVVLEQRALLNMAQLYVAHQDDVRQGQRFVRDLEGMVSDQVDRITTAFDRYVTQHPPVKKTIGAYVRPKSARSTLPTHPFPLPKPTQVPAPISGVAHPDTVMAEAPKSPADQNGMITPDLPADMVSARQDLAVAKADRDARVQAEIAAHRKKGQWDVRLEEKETPSDALSD